MKKVAVVFLVVSTMLLAGVAEAAKPKKRTRNANRVGAYGSAVIGLSNYSSDHTQDEEDLIFSLENFRFPAQNVTASSEDSDIGYQAVFGYRFNRYFAFEVGLAQFGETISTARGEMDVGNGLVPASLALSFSVGGPVFSALGIVPINDKFEFFGRAGLLLASSSQDISFRVDGQNAGSGTSKGDSTNLVLGAGGAWNFNQVYSVRLEYVRIGKVGESSNTGKQELDTIGLAMVIRF